MFILFIYCCILENKLFTPSSFILLMIEHSLVRTPGFARHLTLQSVHFQTEMNVMSQYGFIPSLIGELRAFVIVVSIAIPEEPQ